MFYVLLRSFEKDLLILQLTILLLLFLILLNSEKSAASLPTHVPKLLSLPLL